MHKFRALADAIALITRPVEREPDFLANVAWFFASIVLADFLFYVQHRMIHRRHHEFRDTSSFVAGHKSFTEYCLTSVTDLALFLILGRDLAQLCAWTLVGNAYNLEGHSSLSLFYVGIDFHDRHHTHFNRNFGIQGFWDKIFGTHDAGRQCLQPGRAQFPVAVLCGHRFP